MSKCNELCLFISICYTSIVFSVCVEEFLRLNFSVTSDELDLEGGSVCVMGPEGTTACSGDSGGPLIQHPNILIGVVSWGSLPCGIGPNVFVNVGHYVKWIKSAVGELDWD